MMTEIAKIKRRRQGEYKGVVNETIVEPKDVDLTPEQVLIKELWVRSADSSHIKKLVAFMKTNNSPNGLTSRYVESKIGVSFKNFMQFRSEYYQIKILERISSGKYILTKDAIKICV